jgi:hypothetical protein
MDAFTYQICPSHRCIESQKRSKREELHLYDLPRESKSVERDGGRGEFLSVFK